MPRPADRQPDDVRGGTIFVTWWPLACSWLLMGLEALMFVAAVSRLPDPEPNLFAFSSVVYPISMVVEGPIVMLLAASTALVVDRVRYRQLRRFTLAAAAALTLVHALIAFTPIYDVIATEWIEMDPVGTEPGRLGLRIMLPWSAAIAYRRFQQGVLIRNGRSRAVGFGTLVRLVANGGVLIAGVSHGGVHGVVVGATAIACGVTAEALFVAWVTRGVLRDSVPAHDPATPPLTTSDFLRFYVPLALTPLITLAMQPITAAAIWRLPEASRSSASWSALYGLIFLFRALGFAFQEVVVSLTPRSAAAPRALARFGITLAALASTACAVVAFTPLGRLWFDRVLGLPADLQPVATAALTFGWLLPAVAVLQNWTQGQLVARKRTRGITEAVAVYLVTAVIGFAVAVEHWRGLGIEAAVLVLTIAGVAQLAWLRYRARSGALASVVETPSTDPSQDPATDSNS